MGVLLAAPGRAICCAIAIALLAAAPSGWDAKATASERRASNAVGGFNTLDGHLYHQGLEHLYHTHQRIGGFTIRQVVEQERAREVARNKIPSYTRSPATDSSDRLGVIIFIAILIGVGFAIRIALRSSGRNAQLFRDTSYLDGPLVPVDPGNVIPKRDERFYWAVDAAEIAEVDHPEYVRGNAGVSFRVARGIYLHGGGSRGHTVHNASFEVVDRGRLLLSNTRFVFVGMHGIESVAFSHIVSVEAFSNGLTLNREHGKPRFFRTGTPREAVVLRRLIAGDIADHRPAPPATLPPAESSGFVRPAPEQATVLLARIDHDRIMIAQQKAAGSISEAEYAKAMRTFDELAAVVSNLALAKDDSPRDFLSTNRRSRCARSLA